MDVIAETGSVYGKLTVIERADELTRKGAYWLCQCSCGNKAIVLGQNLRHGETKSCGCSVRLPPGEGAFRLLFRRVKKQARDRDLVFKLGRDDTRRMMKQACFYCGIEPRQTSGHATQRYNGSFIYNGLDRLDNNKGYTIDNVVACCRTCNFAKGTLSQNDFLSWLDRVCRYRTG